MLIPLLAVAMSIQSADSDKGSDLYRECKNWVALVDKTRKLDELDTFEAGTCRGYIDGISSGLISLGVTCPGNATMGTMIRVYLVYVDKHPKVLDFPPSAGVYGAFEETYPCHKK